MDRMLYHSWKPFSSGGKASFFHKGVWTSLPCFASTIGNRPHLLNCKNAAAGFPWTTGFTKNKFINSPKVLCFGIYHDISAMVLFSYDKIFPNV
jgi:hypothetical protein